MIKLLLAAALALPLLAYAASENSLGCACGQCEAGCTCCIDGGCVCSECACVECGCNTETSADLSAAAEPSCCLGGQCSLNATKEAAEVDTE